MGKVLLLVPDLRSPGGVSNYYRALALDRYDSRVEYFVVNAPTQQSLPRTLVRLLSNYCQFWRKISNGDYTLVVINPSLSTRSYYRDVVFCWLAQKKGKHVLLFFRGWAERLEARIRRPSLARFLFLHTFGRARYFITLGEQFRDKLLQMGCPADARYWIESTVADDQYLRDFCITGRLAPPRQWRILFMSRLVPAKGAEIALDAFHMARQQYPHLPMKLVVAGDGPQLPYLRQRVRDEGIEGVELLGEISGERRKEALLNSHIFLLPTTHDEGMPNVLLEAMLYGMPVLSRPVGSIPEVIEDGNHGFLTSATDPAVFADLLCRLVSQPALYQRFAMANHERSRALYTVPRVRSRLMAILAELSAPSRRGAPRQLAVAPAHEPH